MRNRQVDEFLIVRVFASAGRFDSGFSRHMVLVKAIQNVLSLDVGPGHALDDVRVSEHAFQFVARPEVSIMKATLTGTPGEDREGGVAVDADGKNDFAVTTGAGNVVTVYLNTTPSVSVRHTPSPKHCLLTDAQADSASAQQTAADRTRRSSPA